MKDFNGRTGAVSSHRGSYRRIDCMCSFNDCNTLSFGLSWMEYLKHESMFSYALVHESMSWLISDTGHHLLEENYKVDEFECFYLDTLNGQHFASLEVCDYGFLGYDMPMYTSRKCFMTRKFSMFSKILMKVFITFQD